MDTLSHIQTLTDLREAVERFDGCALKQHALHTVFCDGQPDADVMLIGEAPGREEDEQGRPFVGRSGRLLDTLLGEIGLDRTNVYITNMLFWRPPDNRTPTPDELKSCQHFVLKHIDLVRPKLLLFVGGTSAKFLLNRKEGVTKLRGQWHTFFVEETGFSVPAFALYHPAYVLRSPVKAGAVIREDLQEIRRQGEAMGVSFKDIIHVQEPKQEKLFS